MPGLFHRPVSRRSFLHTAALGSTALLVSGCRTGGLRASAQEQFHLALLSDTHVPGDRQNGHRGFNPWENLRRITPQVVAARPTATVLCGDAARLEGTLEDYRELRTLLEPVAAVCPVHIGLGNHDNRAKFFEVFPNPPGLPPKVEGRHVTILEHPALRLVLLDSLLYVNQTAGLLGRNQRRWLHDYLPTAVDRPIVLFVHHTLNDGDGDLLDVEALFALIRPHRQVKAICYGHSHVWALGERQRVQLINLPAVGYNFRDQDPVGWMDARFRRDGVALTLQAFAGNTADAGRTFEIRWTR